MSDTQDPSESFEDYSNGQSPPENRKSKNIGLNSTIQEMDESNLGEDFFEATKSRIRISSRNRIVKEKLKQDENEDPSYSPRLSLYSTERVDMMVQEQLEQRRKQQKSFRMGASLLNPIEKKILIESGSCFMWYLMKEKSLCDVIPDYEIVTCKQVFQETIDKMPGCYEANFGLGRIFIHELKYEQALKYIREALKHMPNDPLYNTWYTFLQSKLSQNNKQELLKTKMMMEALQKRMPKQLEILWGLFELSMSGALIHSIDIELPQYYASHIKDIDTYYGYLAWSKFYIKNKETDRGLTILQELVRSNQDRPEAYVILWEYTYHQMKDFELSEGIAAEAFLRVIDYDYHQYYIMFCFCYAKSYFKNKKLNNCLGLLLQKYIEHPTYTAFLYHYGRLSAKSGEKVYAGSTIDALHESLRLCKTERFGKIYYWLSIVYIQQNRAYDAYSCIKKALQHLGANQQNKIKELKLKMEELRPKIELKEALEQGLQRSLTKEEIGKCKNMCAEIRNYQKDVGDILNSKLIWIEGDEDEAIAQLEEAATSGEVSIKTYSQLFKSLKLKSENRLMKRLGKAMILRCSNPDIPVSVWMKAHIIYANILAINLHPEKAMNLLKCLAKIFPPLPFAEIPYTKTLKKAKTLEDLNSASAKVIESSSSYNYTNYRNSQANILSGEYFESFLKDQPESNQEGTLAAKIVEDAEEDISPLERRFSTERRGAKTLSHKIEENKKSRKMPVAIPKPSNSIVFSVCSDATFLYKIGKIAVLNRYCIEDGLCAIQDYLTLLKFNQSPKKKEKMRLKALFWKALLLEMSFDLPKALVIMREIIGGLETLGDKNKVERIRRFLESHQ